MVKNNRLKLSLSTTATLGAVESGLCRQVAVVERFKRETMYGLSSEKSDRSRQVTVVERWPLVEVGL